VLRVPKAPTEPPPRVRRSRSGAAAAADLPGWTGGLTLLRV